MKISMRQRTGGGRPVDLPPTLGLYVWGTGGLLVSLERARDEIEATRPDAIVLHGPPSELLGHLAEAVRRVRARHPWARVWVGVGMDGTAGQWRMGSRVDEDVIRPLRKVAALCESLGIETIVWNGESQWKDSVMDRVTPAQIEALADQAGREVTSVAPSCIHWLSSFDQPNLHGSLRAFLRGFTRWTSCYSGQAYVAAAHGQKGALEGRLAAAARGQELAERAGYLPDDVTGEDTATDVDRVPTIQAHETHLADLARAAAELPHVLVWSAPLVSEGGRADADGVTALRFARVVRASGLTVAEWQRSKGLVPDGTAGPKTLAAAGLA